VEGETAIQLVCKKMTREELIFFYFRKAEVKKGVGWRGGEGGGRKELERRLRKFLPLMPELINAT
jgi:hypothetical protein